MNQPMKRATLSALAVVFGLLQAFPVCAQDSQTPPADWREQYAYTLGVQAYVFAFPWSYLPELRYAWVTQEPSNPSTPYAPLNHFWHMWKLADADYRDGGSPNYDTLYSLAWLDVGQEPVILSHPDVEDRYFTFQIASMSSDNVDYVGSRTTGSEGGTLCGYGSGLEGRTSAGSSATETVPDRRSVSLRTYRSHGTGRCCCREQAPTSIQIDTFEPLGQGGSGGARETRRLQAFRPRARPAQRMEDHQSCHDRESAAGAKRIHGGSDADHRCGAWSGC